MFYHTQPEAVNKLLIGLNFWLVDSPTDFVIGHY